MYIHAIDPGNEESAYIIYDKDNHKIVNKYLESNDKILTHLREFSNYPDSRFAVEMVASYGMPVGKTVFETCVWIGRFVQVFSDMGEDYRFIYRKEVSTELCKKATGSDSTVRQAILDVFPGSGGGKTPQVGVKDNPGPLYGVKKDLWSALGVALTYSSMYEDLDLMELYKRF